MQKNNNNHNNNHNTTNESRVKNRAEDLRNHLFAVLERLTDEEKPMPAEQALAVCEVSAQIIKSAEVEVKFLAVTRSEATPTFFEKKPPTPLALAATNPNGNGNGRKTQ